MLECLLGGTNMQNTEKKNHRLSLLAVAFFAALIAVSACFFAAPQKAHADEINLNDPLFFGSNGTTTGLFTDINLKSPFTEKKEVSWDIVGNTLVIKDDLKIAPTTGTALVVMTDGMGIKIEEGKTFTLLGSGGTGVSGSPYAALSVQGSCTIAGPGSIAASMTENIGVDRRAIDVFGGKTLTIDGVSGSISSGNAHATAGEQTIGIAGHSGSQLVLKNEANLVVSSGTATAKSYGIWIDASVPLAIDATSNLTIYGESNALLASGEAPSLPTKGVFIGSTSTDGSNPGPVEWQEGEVYRMAGSTDPSGDALWLKFGLVPTISTASPLPNGLKGTAYSQGLATEDDSAVT
jgi:hypothetical protein